MSKSREPAPLRYRVLVVIVGVAALAVVLFAVPLAVAVGRLYRNETTGALERDAAWIAAAVPDDLTRGTGVPVSLPEGLPTGRTVGVYTIDGRLLSGDGPQPSGVVTGAHDGHVHDAVENGFLAVSVPIPSDQSPAGAVRVATPYARVEDRVHRTWLAMAGLGVIVIGLATMFALRQSARLAAPLEHLTRAAQDLGAGDFSIRAPRSDIREANTAGLALEATARRLGEVLDRERAFSADVSHQLRTQLTGMLLGLESALVRPGADLPHAIRVSLTRGERLHAVIDDLVRLSRDTRPRTEPLDVGSLLEEARADWHGALAAQGRRLSVNLPGDLPPAQASAAAIRQILRVLLENATVHGRGETVIDVADLGDAIAIEIADQGEGIADQADVFARRSGHGDGHGIGLALARSLAEAEGGRLTLRRGSPPVFSLLLPSAPDQT
ncbi:HAMP domain-containing sensor histidine kinase [Streptosporangium canum]|uniref:sensor histidine kinase n=1 Tax=Streptosporangium canum TaxID=324952 RepID=UPI0033BEB93C